MSFCRHLIQKQKLPGCKFPHNSHILKAFPKKSLHDQKSQYKRQRNIGWSFSACLVPHQGVRSAFKKKSFFISYLSPSYQFFRHLLLHFSLPFYCVLILSICVTQSRTKSIPQSLVLNQNVLSNGRLLDFQKNNRKKVMLCLAH